MQTKSYYVYILLCGDGSFYTGITNSVERRVAEHHCGRNVGCYTYNRRPLRLMHVEAYEDVWDAIRREKQIQRWSRRKKISLIQNDEVRLKQDAKKKFMPRYDSASRNHSA